MKNALLIITAGIIGATAPANAGSLSNGKWSPTGCGNVPQAPMMDNSNIEAFNKSILAFNDWQQQSRTYFECLIKEANTDNQLIAESANKEQEKYRAQLEKFSAEAKAMGDALEQK